MTDASTAQVHHGLPIRGSFISEHPVAFGVTALGGVAAGALIGWLLLSPQAASGDEPPIRVKNGSLELEIVGSPHKWKKRDTDGKLWEFNAGQRGNRYTVAITPLAGGTCTGTRATGDSMTITYSDGSKVTLTITNNRTQVTSDVVLEPDGRNRKLTYGAGGFIAQLTVGASTCSFASAGELQDALVLDLDQ